jgi:hypothetical protein
VTIYLSQNQILKKLDISSTFSKSVPEIIGYIHPSSDISDIAQFSREFRLSQNLPDISGQDQKFLTLGFLAYKKASRTPSASSFLFSPQLHSSDQEVTPGVQGFPPTVLEDSLGIFLPYLG